MGFDLKLDLKLYRVPTTLMRVLQERYPRVEFSPVNVPEAPNVREDIEVYWGNRITPEIIDACRSLRWIHFGSVGVNRARTPAVIDRDIVVTNSQGLVIATMVASAIAFMTGLARGIHHSYFLRKQGRLSRETFDTYFGEVQELHGQTCLIVGLGSVGRRLALVCDALGMVVIGIRQNVNDSIPGVSHIHPIKDLVFCAAEADYVINLLPLTTETAQAFGETVFRAMKPTAFFINIGRGETVDEPAMIRALSEGWIAGAGLDVFAIEPLPSESPLWAMDNVILTPHVAGLSAGYWSRQGELFEFNLERYLNGDIASMRNRMDMSKAL